MHSPTRRELYRAVKRRLFASVVTRWRESRAALRRVIANRLRGKSRTFLLRLIRDRAFASALASGILAVSSAAAAPTIELSDIALDANAGGFAINGIGQSDFSGDSVSGAGDVNGDGIPDLVIGAYYGDGGGVSSGESYVVFGKSDGTAIELSDVAAGTGGFVINGVGGGDWSGSSVSGAGDVNGDNLDDIIIGAYRADPDGVGEAGESYVVFGKADTDPVELSDVAAGTGGFIIKGETFIMQSGQEVSGAGDVNGDGLDDVVIASNGYDPYHEGACFVVFGKNNGTAVELTDVGAGTGGFVMLGITYDGLGMRASGAGDVNGDNFDDVIVSSWSADLATGNSAGQSYVVFGKASTTAVDLSDIAAGTGGFIINGRGMGNEFGWDVSCAGDVNGDGLDDLLVASPEPFPGGGTDKGQAFVVFGKTDGTPIELQTVLEGAGGFAMNGEHDNDNAGVASGAGDINGDGLDDVIVGAPGAYPNGVGDSGRSYVIFSPIAGPEQWVDFAYTGVPEGTQTLPFQRLEHAVRAVTPGGTINIKGDTATSVSDESLVIDKAVTLEAINGAVIIGAP